LLPQVPLQADVEMGQRALLELKTTTSSTTSTRDVYDRHWTPLIQSIGWELVDVAKTTAGSVLPYDDARILDDYVWDFGILQEEKEDGTVNAFCLPGGIIRITLPLLRQLQLTNGELAALIGHEMGHALHRHAQARKLQQRVVEYVLQAILYDDKDDDQESFGQAVGELLIQSVDWLGKQSFSRRDEYQADETSWDLLYHSQRYDPRALQSLLTKLWNLHNKQGGRTSWDSTHPGTLDRIDFLNDKYQSLTNSEKRTLQRRNTIS